jgi:hypothetical protein
MIRQDDINASRTASQLTAQQSVEEVEQRFV